MHDKEVILTALFLDVSSENRKKQSLQLPSMIAIEPQYLTDTISGVVHFEIVKKDESSSSSRITGSRKKKATRTHQERIEYLRATASCSECGAELLL